MPVRIRLSRFGRLHRPFFRIVACDGRVHREGKANEVLGVYDPLLKQKNVEIDLAKVEAWVKRGAQISESLRSLLKHHGYAVPVSSQPKAAGSKSDAAKSAAAKKKAAPKPTAKGTYVAPSRRALRQHQAKLKAARKAEAEKNKPAAPAAEAPAEQPKA